MVYVPVNSGLRYVREQGLERVTAQLAGAVLTIIEERGENIPGRVGGYSGTSNLAIGITGVDLFEEYRLKSERQRRTLALEKLCTLGLLGTGPYVDTVFGLPALCLIGREGRPIEEFRRRAARWGWGSDNDLIYEAIATALPSLRGKKVIFPWRYERLVRSLVPQSDVRWLPFERSVDVQAARDPTIDYAVDIVCSGRTCEAYGLGVYNVLFRSDGVIIGNERAKVRWGDGA